MTEMRGPVILEAVRTPFAKSGEAFREIRPDALLAHTLDGLLERAGMDAEKIEDVINSTVTQAGELEPDMDRVNPGGGAIAHGHPLGATGAGLMAKMLAGLEATDGQFGLQVICIGHGMSTATILERI
jgi:acetyl-CoA acetyltransferase